MICTEKRIFSLLKKAQNGKSYSLMDKNSLIMTPKDEIDVKVDGLGNQSTKPKCGFV